MCGSLRRKPTVSEDDDRPAADAVEARVARVERREEAVLGELLRGGEAVEEGRLAGVRVADEGDGRDVAQVPAADVAARLDLLEVFLEGRDPPADLPLVELELLLAAARAEGASAPLLREAGLRAGEARQEVLEAGELDLRHRLAAPGARGEDGEDDVRAVEDLRRQLLLEVAGLRGGELVVEDDHARLHRLRGLDELLQLPLADVGRRVGRRALLEGAGDDDASRRVDETLQLVEVVLGLGAAERLPVNPDEDRLVRLRSVSGDRRSIVRVFLGHSRACYQQSARAGPKETLGRVCSRPDETAPPAPRRSGARVAPPRPRGGLAREAPRLRSASLSTPLRAAGRSRGGRVPRLVARVRTRRIDQRLPRAAPRRPRTAPGLGPHGSTGARRPASTVSSTGGSMPDPSGRSFGPSARRSAPRAPSAPSSRPGTRGTPTTSRPSIVSSRCSGKERAYRRTSCRGDSASSSPPPPKGVRAREPTSSCAGW